ncbi:MAG TPA: hypothetical protein VFU29_10925 [Chitinophagaceae bacterium]|nr:hypothetical protein [Chitinophagaceae bacterium]
MKAIIISFYTIISCVIVRAQDFDVAFYQGMKNIDPSLVKYRGSFYSYETDMQGISGFSANLKRSMHNITLKRYDATLTEKKSTKIKSQEKEFGPLPPALKVVNDKLYLLYYKMNDKSNVILYVAAVDTSTLELSQPSELLTIDEDKKYLEFYMRSVSFDNPNLYVYGSNFASSPTQLSKTFFFEGSPDGNSYLVTWTSSWNNKLFFSVFNKDMKRIRTGKELLADENTLAFANACVDNNSNAYFSYSYSKKGKPFSEVLINKKGGASEVKSVTIPDANPFGAYIAVDKQNAKLMICGAYKNGGEYLAGVYVASLNTDNFVMNAVIKTPFPKDLIEILDDEGWGNKKKLGLSDGLVLEANVLESGVVNLTGEFRRVNTGVRASFHVAGSILNARFNGNTAVFSRIPKVRVSAGSTFGDSYRVFGYKNSLIIFYNDHLSNLKLDISKPPVRSDVYKNSVMAAAIIDSNGLIKRQKVIDQSDEDYLASVESMQEMVQGNYFLAMRRIKGSGGVTSDMKWASLIVR